MLKQLSGYFGSLPPLSNEMLFGSFRISSMPVGAQSGRTLFPGARRLAHTYIPMYGQWQRSEHKRRRDGLPSPQSGFEADGLVWFIPTLTMHTLNKFPARLIGTGSIAWLQRAA